MNSSKRAQKMINKLERQRKEKERLQESEEEFFRAALIIIGLFARPFLDALNSAIKPKVKIEDINHEEIND